MDNRSTIYRTSLHSRTTFMAKKNLRKNFLTMPTLEPGFHLWGKDEFYGERKLSPHRQNRGFSFYWQKYGEKFFYDAYFIDRISTRDFLFFMGVGF